MLSRSGQKEYAGAASQRPQKGRPVRTWAMSTASGAEARQVAHRARRAEGQKKVAGARRQASHRARTGTRRVIVDGGGG